MLLLRTIHLETFILKRNIHSCAWWIEGIIGRLEAEHTLNFSISLMFNLDYD